MVGTARCAVRTSQRDSIPIAASLHGLRTAILATRFAFRQGLWIEDLQIPPGQECSNGSLILLAVVLWRTFLVGRDRRVRRGRLGESSLALDETPQGENSSLRAGGRR